MGTRWRAPAAVAARRRPDAAEAPTGRIDAGAVLDEVDRCGSWVRVQTPDDQHWWIDGRRLEALQPPAPADPPPPTPEAPAPPAPTDPPRPTPTTRHWNRLAVVGTVFVGLAAVVAGVVILTTRDDPPKPPTALTHVITLDVTPELVASMRWGWRESALVSNGDTASILESLGDRLGLTYFSDDGSGSGGVILDLRQLYPGESSGHGDLGLPDVVGITGFGDDLIVVYGDGTAERWHAWSDRRDPVRLPLREGTTCCAGAMAMSGVGNWAVLVPVGPDGRSDSVWIVDVDDGDVTGVELPVAGIVRDVVGHTAVFVALDTGLVAIDHDRDGDCQLVLGTWDLSASKLFLSDPPGAAHRVIALDSDAATITVFDGSGYVSTYDGCRVGRRPVALGTVDLESAVGRPLSLGASLADIDEVAYVLTTEGELLIVDISEPTIVRNDRHMGTIAGLGADDGTTNRLAIVRATTRWPAFVVVAEPDADRLWVISDGDGSAPVETIDLRRGSR